MDRQKILKRLDDAWAALQESYSGVPEARLLEHGVTGTWSVRDILAHITTWEEEALKYLPMILNNSRPPRYSVTHGGINAFNAEMTERKKGLALPEVLQQLDATHRRLVELVRSTPEDQFTSETRFRRRLREDTYGHYSKHAKAIREWRARSTPA